jgi:hypothetical protein
MEDLKPGSGKIWQNKLTVPSVPKITGLKQQKNNGDLDPHLCEPMIIEQPKNQSNEKTGIKCLNRPLSAQLQAHNSRKKRHNLYLKEKQLQSKLLESGNMLSYYVTQVDRKNENDPH